MKYYSEKNEPKKDNESKEPKKEKLAEKKAEKASPGAMSKLSKRGY